MRFCESRRPVILPPRLFLAVASVLGAICVCVTGAAFADAASPGFHFLAADPSLRAQTQNANVVTGQATYVGKVLEPDQPWEAGLTYTFGSVVIDPVTSQWRMYYDVVNCNTNASAWWVAMATSNDGIHWTKPALNVTGTRYSADPRNNFINTPQTYGYGTNVVIDPHAPADQRYRMLDNVGNLWLYADTSADGLNWRRVGTIDYAPGGSGLDAQNTAFWDPKTNQYISYMRFWYDGERRGVMTKRSNTFDTTWTGPREYTIDPKNVPQISSGQADIYCPGVVPYYGQYIGLPTMYYHTDGQMFGSGPVYPTFMYSRDSTNWTFQNPYQPIIDLSAHGQNQQNFGQAYMFNSLPEKDGDLYIYYKYTTAHHNDPDPGPSAMYLAKLREDRFVGVQSTGSGSWTTSAITLSSDPGQLLVNAVVGGSVRVEVLDLLTSEPIPGYSAVDGLPIGPGDFLNAVAGWQGIGDLDALAGQTVVLRFLMNDATVYSFHFESAPEPSTIMLLLCGSTCLLIFRRRRRQRLNRMS